jgi:glycerophosphoryl diester phosphodiesterase
VPRALPPLLSAKWDPPRRSDGSLSRPLVLGHRGARHAAPENTFAAFDLALAEGAEGVELDVRLNADGEIIVCHDVTLTRVTEGSDRRAIHRMGSAECRAVRLAGGERLPFLADVLDWAEQREACVNVELKDGGRRPGLVAAVARLMQARAGAGNLLMSSFNPLVVLAHAALAPAIPTAWLVDSPRLAAQRSLTATGNTALHPRHLLITAASIATWKEQGRRVNTWTVNEPARAVELARLGVDCLISDNPGLLIESLGSAARTAERDARGRELAA